MDTEADLLDLVPELKASGEAFALATVVRTVSATAAKPGAKALIRADGTILNGWIGGGCARSAVSKAAKEAIADGKARLVSIQPEDLLDDSGLSAGEERDGVLFARNMCPSKGTMDVFVEPVLPKPELIIFGASPVAVALADLGKRFDFFCVVCAPAADQNRFPHADHRFEGFEPDITGRRQRYVVVATQGQGDLAALRTSMRFMSRYIAFVGSHRKAGSLREKLIAEGIPAARLDALRAPAGLNIGAITPDEIALSIIARSLDSAAATGARWWPDQPDEKSPTQERRKWNCKMKSRSPLRATRFMPHSTIRNPQTVHSGLRRADQTFGHRTGGKGSAQDRSRQGEVQRQCHA